MNRIRTFIAAALVGLGLALSACDPCSAGYEINFERCNNGDQNSCDWLTNNFQGGTCTL